MKPYNSPFAIPLHFYVLREKPTNQPTTKKTPQKAPTTTTTKQKQGKNPPKTPTPQKKSPICFSWERQYVFASNGLFNSLPSCRKCFSMQAQEMCLCLVISGMHSCRAKGWEMLVDGCASDDLPALTAWPLMVETDHGRLCSTEGFQNAGSVKAGRMSHTRISWCLL